MEALELARAVYLCVKSSIAEDLANPTELAAALRNAGSNPTNEHLEQIFKQASGGTVSFSRFCEILESRMATERRNLHRAFRLLDPNRNGYIDRDTFFHQMTTRGEKMEPEAVEKLWQDAGLNARDQKLDYEKFCSIMMKTTEQCRRLALQKVSLREHMLKINSFTYVISRNKKDKAKIGGGLVKAENGNDLEQTDLFRTATRGCFFWDEGEILGHNYALRVTSSSSVRLVVRSWSPLPLHGIEDTVPGDVTLFLMKDMEGLARQLVACTDRLDGQGNNCTAPLELEPGTYYVVPFTTGCRLRHAASFSKNEIEIGKDRSVQLLQTDARGQNHLTNTFRNVLKYVFELFDLDGNGLLSRQEFSLFNVRASGEAVHSKEWDIVTENFDLENGEIPFGVFEQMYSMSAKDLGDCRNDLWQMLAAVGFDGRLRMVGCQGFEIGVQYSHKRALSLRVTGLLEKDEGMMSGHLDRAVARTILEQGTASAIRNLKDLLLYTLSTGDRTSLAIQNKSHHHVSVRLDCTSSVNCLTHNGSLDVTVQVPPRSTVLALHAVPKDSNKQWTFNCNHKLVD